MSNIYIVGTGATPVAEHFGRSAADLAVEALRRALADVGSALDPARIGALYVASAFGEALTGQAQLGALLADVFGLAGVEALRVEAGGASGGLALRQAALALKAGACEVAVVLGVEKVTNRLEPAIEAALATGADAVSEADHGVTAAAQWALLMRRYMFEYGYPAEAFAPFPVNAHTNAAANPDALYRFPINADKYRKATPIAPPLGMLDCATLADGAAALILAGEGLARELTGPRIRIAASAVSTDALALHTRYNPLDLAAAARSAGAVFAQAHLAPDGIDVLELSDPHGIVAALALEASGFMPRGEAPRRAADGAITPAGVTPLATAGGFKARGDVGGASGVYQALELVRQLRGAAGKAQVADAHIAFAQCLGGIGATAVSHILVAE